MSISHRRWVLIAAVLFWIGAGCGDDSQPVDEPNDEQEQQNEAHNQTNQQNDGEDDPLRGALGKTYEEYNLPGGHEDIVCAQWTLENEHPIYVNAIEMSNDGGFHHSNWYVVPDDHFDGEPDGYFECEERGWNQQLAAIEGTVLFAQSTQAFTERQEFPEGVVTKIPPNHMIVADVHFLNTRTQPMDTHMRVELELLHPELVETIATPFQLIYADLDIPPKSESRFRSECDVAGDASSSFDSVTDDGTFEDLELYYVLPHYHELGNHFDLKIHGGPNDGKELFELTGFNAEANGQTFRPPVDLSGAKGLEFACGFDNPRDESVGWGIGDQEMCMMLGYTNAEFLFDVGVRDGDNEVLGPDGEGIVKNTGDCDIITFPRPDAQSEPDDDELQRDLYIPDSGTTDDFDPEPECADTPDEAQPLQDPTLSNIETDIFSAGCAFSACHGSDGAGAGLSLVGDDVHGELMNHDVQAPVDMPLVDPGNPDNSWLYRLMSECEPEADGTPVSFMPRNSPTLLQPQEVAMVREWIEAGADDD